MESLTRHLLSSISNKLYLPSGTIRDKFGAKNPILNPLLARFMLSDVVFVSPANRKVLLSRQHRLSIVVSVVTGTWKRSNCEITLTSVEIVNIVHEQGYASLLSISKRLHR